MNATPITPAVLLDSFRTLVANALNMEGERVFLTPAPELLGKLPPASEAFAALVPSGVTFEESPQHPPICPAYLRFDVCIFSRVALDRAFDGQKLLTDSRRGLLVLADAVIRAMAGTGLEVSDAQYLRAPLQCLGLDVTRWAEGANIVLAYVVIHFHAPFLYNLAPA